MVKAWVADSYRRSGITLTSFGVMNRCVRVERFDSFFRALQWLYESEGNFMNQSDPVEEK